MQVVVFIGYVLLGFFQFAALMAGLTDWIGLHWLLALPVAFFVSYIPLLGTVFGMVGAVKGWDWSWMQAAALFFGPMLALIVLALAVGAFDSIKKRT